MKNAVHSSARARATSVAGPSIKSPTFDIPLLSALRTHHSLSLRALGYHFATRHGRDVSHVLEVIRRLRRNDLLTTWRMDPRLGQRSQMAASLTPSGHAWLAGLPVPAGVVVAIGAPSRSQDVRDYALQLGHVRLQFEAAGWSHLPAADLFAALQRRAIAVVNATGSRQDKDVNLPRLRNATPIGFAVDGLLHTSGDVRLLLPVRPGVDVRRVLERLPCGINAKTGALVQDPTRRATLGLLQLAMPLAFVCVCTDSDLLPKAERILRSWSAKYRMKFTHSVPGNARSIAHPYAAHRPAPKRYRPDPSRTTLA